MKKALIIIVVLLFVVPASSWAFMAMEEDELADVRAKTGLSIATVGTVITADSITYVDADGAPLTTGTPVSYSSSGWLRVGDNTSGANFLASFDTNPSGSFGTLDVGTRAAGTPRGKIGNIFPELVDVTLDLPHLQLSGASADSVREMGGIWLRQFDFASGAIVSIWGLENGIGNSLIGEITDGRAGVGDTDGFGTWNNRPAGLATFNSAGYMYFDGAYVNQYHTPGDAAEWTQQYNVGTGAGGSAAQLSGGPVNGLTVGADALRLGRLYGQGGTLGSIVFGDMERPSGVDWTMLVSSTAYGGTTNKGIYFEGGFQVSDGYISLGDSGGIPSTHTQTGYVTLSGICIADTIDATTPGSRTGTGMFDFMSTSLNVGTMSDGTNDVTFWVFNDSNGLGSGMAWGEMCFDVRLGNAADSGPAIFEWHTKNFSADLYVRATGAGEASAANNIGLRLDVDFWMTNLELVLGDEDGCVAVNTKDLFIYTSRGYTGLIRSFLSDTSGGSWSVEKATIQGGYNGTLAAMKIQLPYEESLTIGFTPTVDTIPGGTTNGTMFQFQVTGTVAGTVYVTTH